MIVANELVTAMSSACADRRAAAIEMRAAAVKRNAAASIYFDTMVKLDAAIVAAAPNLDYEARFETDSSRETNHIDCMVDFKEPTGGKDAELKLYAERVAGHLAAMGFVVGEIRKRYGGGFRIPLMIPEKVNG